MTVKVRGFLKGAIVLIVALVVVATTSILSLPVQADERVTPAQAIIQEDRGLVGFTGDYALSDDSSQVSVIILFEIEPAAVQMYEAKSEGRLLSESVAKRAVEANHALFELELTELLGSAYQDIDYQDADFPSGETTEAAPFHDPSEADEISSFYEPLLYEILWEYRIALNGVNIILPADRVAEVAEFESVRVIYPDYRMEIEPLPPIDPFEPTRGPEARNPAGMAAGRATMRAAEMHASGYRGEGVLIAMLDTGIYYNHPTFNGAFPTIADMQARGVALTNADGINIGGTYYYVGRNFFQGIHEAPLNNPGEVPPGTPIGGNNPLAGTNHGTHVAGTIVGRDTGTTPSLLGVAPEAQIITYRMLTMTQPGSWIPTGSTVAAVERTAIDRADVVNMSFGSTAANTSQATALTSRSVTNVMLANPDMVFVASAGNSGYQGSFSLTSPGPGSKYITVANVNIGTTGGQPANFWQNPASWLVHATPTGGSSLGPAGESFEIKPDIGAHGTTVLSARPPWTAASGLGTSTGTSMSAPHVAGAAALLVDYSRQNGGQWSASEIKVRLMNNAFPFGTNVGVFDSGAGYVDVYAAAHADTVVTTTFDRAVRGTSAQFIPANFTDSQTGSFSFGNVGNMGDTNGLSLLSTPVSNVRTLQTTIENNSSLARTYTIDYNFTNNPSDAALLTFSQRQITVPPGQSAGFSTTVTVQGAVAAGFYQGHIYVREGTDLVTRSPFALVNENAVNVNAHRLEFNLGSAQTTPASIDAINVLTGTTLTSFLTNYHDGFLPSDPIRAGYTFAGWYLDGSFTIPLVGSTLMPASSTTLHARWILNVPAELSVTAPSFVAVSYGYQPHPVAQAITIANAGNMDAAIMSLELTGADANAFELRGSGATVPGGQSIQTWMIRPVAGLDAGTYTATITVNYDGAASAATATISFTVNPQPLTIVGFNISRPYDGTDAIADIGTLSFSGLVNNETASVDAAGVTAVFAGTTVGVHDVIFTGNFA
ncbi:MAG: S8 family serine peptidase, partial [Coriobacteriia bacterium]|nr:S8 family serine peptidase [Coriobacteriia bacterium]